MEKSKGLPTNTAGPLFWIVGIVALAWNGLSCVNLIQQMSSAGLATLPADYQAYIETRPLWALVAFVVSATGGVLGAVLLFLRSRLTAPAFVASSLGGIVSLISALGSGIPSFVVGSGLSAVLAAVFAWYAARKLTPDA
jgi:hypothetical protein